MQESPTTPEQPSTEREAWYAVGVLALALLVNFLDRGIIALLVPPIKEDLQLTDTQMSLVIGFAFVLFYVALGLPIARLVDSYSRRMIVGICVAIWSGMTALCGLAQNFWQLFAARVGVGVGEAGNGPATYSMLADLFPPERLPRAISVLNFGFVAGNGLALVLGGVVIDAISDLPPVVLPVVGELRPWQLTLVAVGLPGLAIAGLMGTVREPPRRGVIHRRADGTPGAPPVRDVMRFVGGRWRTYLPMTAGMALKAVLSIGVAVWLPTHFVREFGWPLARIGVTQGIILMLMAPAGLMAGSFLAERLAKRGRLGANLEVVILSGIIALPITVTYPLVGSPTLALALYACSVFCLFLAPGPQNAAIQIITPNQMRGQVTALWLFVFNVVGFGAGPTVIALVTDFVFRDEARLGHALSLGSAVLGVLALVVLWSGLAAYRESVRETRAG